MDSKYQWTMTPLAQTDIDETLSYIAINLSSPQAAKHMFSTLSQTIENICRFPMSYPGCEYYYINDTNYRHAVIGNYILFYRINEDSRHIEILRFIYSGRNIRQTNIISDEML